MGCAERGQRRRTGNQQHVEMPRALVNADQPNRRVVNPFASAVRGLFHQILLPTLQIPDVMIFSNRCLTDRFSSPIGITFGKDEATVAKIPDTFEDIEERRSANEARRASLHKTQMTPFLLILIEREKLYVYISESFETEMAAQLRQRRHVIDVFGI